MSDPEDESSDEQSADEREPTDGTNLPEEGEVEDERAERLDPENRPDGAEIDNTQRDFDEKTGYFTDSEGADDAPPQYATEDEES